MIEYLTIEELQDRTLITDVETFENYFLVSFKCVDTGKIFYLEESPDSDLNKYLLSSIMMRNRTVGFNSIGYDIPMIWAAYFNPNTTFLKTISDALILEGVWPKELAKNHGFVIHQTRHVDLIEVCPLKGSLKTYGARLHAKHLQDLPFDPHQLLTAQEAATVREYNFNDLDLTLLVWNNLKEQIDLRTKLSEEYKTDLMSKSDAQIAEAVIGSEIKKITSKYPSKPTIDDSTIYSYKPPSYLRFQTPLLEYVFNVVCNAKYTLEYGVVKVPNEVKELNIHINKSTYRLGNGGLHSSEKNECYVADDSFILVDNDVASYYPMIILNNNLCPQHLGQNFLDVYRSLVERRLAAKKAKQNAIADSLKIVINGSFGKLGSPYSILYSPDLLIQVTVTGQLSLLMLIESLELVGIPIISANTDGIVAKCPVELYDKMREVIQDWENVTNFQTEETRYKAVYSRDVNAYLALKDDGSFKGKNAYFDPWSGGSKEAIFRFHKNPQTTICIEAAKQYIKTKKPVAETIREATDITTFITARKVDGGATKDGVYLGKVIRWYYALNEFGTINYQKSGNKVPDTDGAKPIMTLTDTLPDDINYFWYEMRANELLKELQVTNRKSKIVSFFE
jgi:hypothetical protein